MRQANLLRAGTLAALLTLAACGGGGGGGGGSSGGGGNAAPIIAVAAPASAYEDRTFSIDTRGSSDAGGTIQSLTVTQTGGPPVAPAAQRAPGRFSFIAPQIAGATEDVIFEVRATDNDGAVSTRTVRIAVREPSGPGAAIGVFNPPLDLRLGNVARPDDPTSARSTAFAVQPINGEFELVELGEDMTGRYDYSREIAIVDARFRDVSFIQWEALTTYNVGLSDEFLVVSEAEDALRWFYRESTSTPQAPRYVQGDSVSITDPCHMARRTNSSQDFMWVGQRNGFSVVRIVPNFPPSGPARSFDDIALARVQTARALCYIYPTNLSPPGPTARYVPLLALDYTHNEIVFYRAGAGPQIYDEIAAIPIETQSTRQLSIVSVHSFGYPHLVPRYLVVLMSDGAHTGNHRLIRIAHDGVTPTVSQQVLGWSTGAPVAAVEADFDGDQLLDVVVVSGTSPQALFFKNVLGPNATSADPPIYAAPVAFDIGAPAASAVAMWSETFQQRGILVSFKDTGDLRFFTVP